MSTARARRLRSRGPRAVALPAVYHVVTADRSRHWRVVRGGKAPSLVAEASTRAQAVYRASVLAQADLPSRLLVHGSTGVVEALRDYA